MGDLKFIVIDKKTGREADTYKIALTEDWAKGLIYCDIEGFAITDEGELILCDECGKFVYCDRERFEVAFEKPVEEIIKELFNCRDELCLKCERYKEAYRGACDDCRYNRENMRKYER